MQDHPFTRPRSILTTATLCAPLAALSVLAVLPSVAMGQAPATAAATTGRIAGTVEISSTLAARRPQFRIYADPGAGANPPRALDPADALQAELHNVVIYLDADSTQLPTSPARTAAAKHARISQQDERFVPHVVALMVGGTVDFPNEDDFYHNVFSLSSAAGAKGFDLGRYPKNASRTWTFPKPGIVQVFCHIHSDMSAVVLLLRNPFFTNPDDDRHFVLDDVPEGEYTIVGWHERARPVTRRVHVTAGQTTTVDFSIPVPQIASRP